jgi:hypothetical protein
MKTKNVAGAEDLFAGEGDWRTGLVTEWKVPG